MAPVVEIIEKRTEDRVTFGVRVTGLSLDEAEGLAERVQSLVDQLEQGPTHADTVGSEVPARNALDDEVDMSRDLADLRSDLETELGDLKRDVDSLRIDFDTHEHD